MARSANWSLSLSCLMLRRNTVVLLALSLAGFLLLANDLGAQITNVTNDTATPMPGVGHDYIKMLSETVNPSNGSVSLRIATPVPKGRGLTIPFSFAYDSSSVHHIAGSANGQATWGSSSKLSGAPPNSSFGWNYVVPSISSVDGVQTTPGPNGIPYFCTYTDGYIFTDAAGTRHALPLGLVYTSDCGKVTTSFLTGGDGVYQAVLATTGGLTVADPDGTVYQLPGRGYPYSAEDRNGNKVTFTTGTGGAFTEWDTAGRTVISASGFGITGNTVTIPGLNPYTLTWGAASANFSVGYTQVGSFPGCSGIKSDQETENVVSRIALPNGKSYQFYYDSTYGLLNKIVYPTGATVTYAWGLNSRSEIANWPDANGNANVCKYTYDNYAVAHRYLSFDGVTNALQQDFAYSTAWNGNTWSSKTTTVTTRDLVRGTSFTTTYTYLPSSLPNSAIYETTTVGAKYPLSNR